MLQLPASERVFVALDIRTFGDTEMRLIDRTADHVAGYKIGLTAQNTRVRPGSCAKVADEIEYFLLKNYPTKKRFFDGKWKDIPDQMAGAASGIAASGAWGFTVHASNHVAALRAAVDNAGEALAIGVTVLTSMSDADSIESYGDPTGAKVVRFARKFAAAGGKALVCSPKELLFLSGIPLIKITPGIRNEDSPPDDQKRTATAYDAIRNGASYLVIGRPITGATDPGAAAARFVEDVQRGIVAHG